MSLTSSSSSRHRNLIWRNMLERMLSLLLRFDFWTSTSLVCSMNHIPRYIYFRHQRTDDGDLKTTIFVGFLFTLCYQMLTWEICFEHSSPPLSSPTPSPTTNLRLSPPPPPQKKLSLSSPSITFIIQDGCMTSPHFDSTPTN